MSREKNTTTQKKNAPPRTWAERQRRAFTAYWKPITAKSIEEKLNTYNHYLGLHITQATAKAATKPLLSILRKARTATDELTCLPGVEPDVRQYAVIAYAAIDGILDKLQRSIVNAKKPVQRKRRNG